MSIVLTETTTDLIYTKTMDEPGRTLQITKTFDGTILVTESIPNPVVPWQQLRDQYSTNPHLTSAEDSTSITFSGTGPSSGHQVVISKTTDGSRIVRVTTPAAQCDGQSWQGIQTVLAPVLVSATFQVNAFQLNAFHNG